MPHPFTTMLSPLLTDAPLPNLWAHPLIYQPLNSTLSLPLSTALLLFIYPPHLFFNHMLHSCPPLPMFTHWQPQVLHAWSVTSQCRCQLGLHPNSVVTGRCWNTFIPPVSPTKPFIGALLVAALLLWSYRITVGGGFACDIAEATRVEIRAEVRLFIDWGIEFKELHFCLLWVNCM